LFVVAAPLFPVLRLVSLCFSIPLVLLTFVLVDRWVGRRGAWTAAGLIAFAPPGYQFLNCTVYGTHLEGNLVMVGLVFLYLSWREAARTGWKRTAGLGLASGLAVWFGYGQCAVLGVLLLVELASSGPKSVLRRAPPFALGLVVGLSPWIANALRHPDRALNIYDRSIAEHFTLSSILDQRSAAFGNLFVVDGPRSFWFNGVDPSAGMLIAHVFFWGIVLLFGCCLWIERGQIAAFTRALAGREARFDPSLRLMTLLFIATWLCLFGLSDLRLLSSESVLGCRYLMPLFPFIAILAGTAVEDSPTRRLRATGIAVIVLVTTVNAAGTIAQLRPDRLASHAQAPATSTAWHVRMIVRRFGNDPEAMSNILVRIDAKRAEPERTQLVDWIAKCLASIAASPPEPVRDGSLDLRPFAETLSFLAEHAPESQRPAFRREFATLQATGSALEAAGH
jgi:hypothetical protein